MIPFVWWKPDGWNFSVAKAQSFKVYLDLILLRLCETIFSLWQELSPTRGAIISIPCGWCYLQP